MSQSDIRIALEKELIRLDSTFPIAISNVKFKPTSGVSYQSCKVIPQTVENPTYGDNFHRENGVFQIMLCFVLYEGEGDILLKADEVKEWFYRGKSITQGTTTVTIRTTPTIGTAYVTEDRYCIPISIFYYANLI